MILETGYAGIFRFENIAIVNTPMGLARDGCNKNILIS